MFGILSWVLILASSLSVNARPACGQDLGVAPKWGRRSASGAHSELTLKHSFAPLPPTMHLRGGISIYKDIVSGDEMVSDSFPMELVDDIVFKVTTRMVVKGAVDVNIGANPAEGEDVEVDDTAEKVNDVMDAFRLQSMGSFDKKGILSWAKTFLKAIKEKLDEEDPERSKVFQEKSQKWVKEFLLKHADDFEFVTGPSFNTEGSMGMKIYEGENINPHIYFFKDGLTEEKC